MATAACGTADGWAVAEPVGVSVRPAGHTGHTGHTRTHRGGKHRTAFCLAISMGCQQRLRPAGLARFVLSWFGGADRLLRRLTVWSAHGSALGCLGSFRLLRFNVHGTAALWGAPQRREPALRRNRCLVLASRGSSFQRDGCDWFTVRPRPPCGWQRWRGTGFAKVAASCWDEAAAREVTPVCSGGDPRQAGHCPQEPKQGQRWTQVHHELGGLGPVYFACAKVRLRRFFSPDRRNAVVGLGVSPLLG